MSLLRPALVTLICVSSLGCPGEPRTAAQDGPSAPPAAVPQGEPAKPWPPVKGERFPDLQLLDHTGAPVKLSDYEGKVIVVEPIGISCPACQAFAGAHQVGAFRNGQPQEGLPSFEELLKQFGGVELSSETDLVYVHLLLYDMSASRAPTQQDGKEWAEHFGVDALDNGVVLVGDARYVNPASYAMIPGFYLIDRSFVLRGDGTGHNPKDDPYRTVLAMVPDLLAE